MEFEVCLTARIAKNIDGNQKIGTTKTIRNTGITPP